MNDPKQKADSLAHYKRKKDGYMKAIQEHKNRHLHKNGTIKGGLNGAIEYFISEGYSSESAHHIVKTLQKSIDTFSAYDDQMMVDAVFHGLTNFYLSKGLKDSVARNHARRDIARRGLKKSLITMSYNDLKNTLQEDIKEVYGHQEDDGTWSGYPYVINIYNNEVVVSDCGNLLIAPYSLEGNSVTIGEFVPAEQVFVPAPADEKSPRARMALDSGGLTPHPY